MDQDEGDWQGDSWDPGFGELRVVAQKKGGGGNNGPAMALPERKKFGGAKTRLRDGYK